MNPSSSSQSKRRKIEVTLVALASIFVLSSSVRAQTPGDTVYFDPNNSKTTTAGGTGDFSTSDFWDPSTSTDAPFVSGSTPVVVTPYIPPTAPPPATGTNGTTTIASYGETAVFNGPGSTVAVSLPVTPYSLQIGVTSGTETFGTTGAEAQISFPLGDNVGLSPIVINSSGATGTENVVFNSNINFDIAQPYYNNTSVGLNSYTSGNIAINGGITFSNYTTDGDSVGEPNLNLAENVAGGTITINSAITAVNETNSTPIANLPYLLFSNPAGVLTLTSNASFNSTTLDIQAGTVYDQGAKFSTPVGGNYLISVGATGEYLTDANNVNVTTNIVFNNGGGTIGGALADTTTFSGQEIVGYSGTAMDLTAAAGGRVNFTGDIHNGNNDSIVKVGAGTIALKNTQGRGEDQNAGWEVQNGTMLINGSDSNGTSLSGSGVQIDNVAKASLAPGVQTYATLGGTGDTHLAVTAVGANSSITPGDPTVNGGIGTLTLNGGLAASNGLTLNFVLDGEGNTIGVDSSQLIVPDLTLNGAVTVNFSTVDTVETGVYYTVMDAGNSPTADWNLGTVGSGLSFAFNAPAGYAVENYILSPGGDTFSVEFESVPEPSTWALMGLGAVLVAGAARLRRQQA
jgi:hypothetical protein